jgi:benzodiazapine receptor
MIVMSRSAYVVLNWIALIVMLAVNALANVLPINGYNSAQVSAMYPNLFVPAGFTFGIWGFIYFLLTLHVIYSNYMLTHLKRSANDVGCLVFRINRLFWITCFLNTAWIIAWHFLLIWLSVLIMIGLFITLLLIFKEITIAEREIDLGYMEHISLETPFIIYFSWIAVALIANVTALLVSQGWHPATETVWSCLMIGVAGIIGVSLSLFWHRPAYTAVIIWAIFGIYTKNADISPLIATTAITTSTACLLAAAIGFWHKRNLLFRPSVQTD